MNHVRKWIFLNLFLFPYKEMEEEKKKKQQNRFLTTLFFQDPINFHPFYHIHGNIIVFLFRYTYGGQKPTSLLFQRELQRQELYVPG